MALQIINVGTVANDGTGDPLRDAMMKVQANFSLLYAVLPVDINGNPVPAAPINSPHFTGDPTAPTPLPGDNDSSIATTAFVTEAVATGTAGLAPINSPLFTGDPRAPTPPNSDNDTSIPTTAWVKTNFVGFDPGNPPPAGTNLSAYAPLNSPLFTGDPRAPTPAAADNDTSIATTAFVKAAIIAGAGGGGVASATPPSSPVSGQFWYDLTTGILAIYIDDGNSLQWVAVSGFVTAL